MLPRLLVTSACLLINRYVLQSVSRSSFSESCLNSGPHNLRQLQPYFTRDNVARAISRRRLKLLRVFPTWVFLFLSTRFAFLPFSFLQVQLELRLDSAVTFLYVLEGFTG